MGKEIPVISKLLKAMIVEDYKGAMDIVSDEDFNPNEKTKTWEAPVISALLTVLINSKNKELPTEAKAVFKAIISNKSFNPNEVDKENETILMHIARNRNFSWLAPFVLDCPSIDLYVKNYMGRTALDIANNTGNIIVRDLIIAYNTNIMRDHLPKKREGIKKKKKQAAKVTVSSSILNNIEMAFSDEAKNNPVSLYNLIKYFIKGNYDECLRIVKDVHFNPNESDRWDEPALSSLIYYSQDSTVIYDAVKFREIALGIINNRMFDVNALDADCNTVLMVAMSFPKLNWLVRELFKISSARIDVINDMGEDINAIAEKCGNSELLSDMIRRNYETANVIE